MTKTKTKTKIDNMVKKYMKDNTTNDTTHDQIIEKLIEIRHNIDALKSAYREDNLQSRLNLDHARGAEASLIWVLGGNR